MNILDAECTERMKSAVGFRNIAIHEYETINWEIVYTICHEHLDDFRRFARCVIEAINNHDARR